MSISTQKFTSIAVVASLLGLGNIITANSASAYTFNFDNGDFEDSTLLDGSTGWMGLGSSDIRGSYSSVSPDGTQQGIVTTACPDGNHTFCQNSRNDDPGNSIGTFNLLGKDQLSASPEIADLQTSLGLSPNSLSIQREFGGTPLFDTEGNPLYRIPKEGSAIFQNIEIIDDGKETDTLISFKWDFFTNDGAGNLGDKDFGFVFISGGGYENVITLEDSTGSISVAGSTDYATNISTYQPFSLTETLPPGNYKVGFGVVDVDGSGYSSALAFDNFNIEQVPFDSSPNAGLVAIVSIFGLNRLFSKFKSSWRVKKVKDIA